MSAVAGLTRVKPLLNEKARRLPPNFTRSETAFSGVDYSISSAETMSARVPKVTVNPTTPTVEAADFGHRSAQKHTPLTLLFH